MTSWPRPPSAEVTPEDRPSTLPATVQEKKAPSVTVVEVEGGDLRRKSGGYQRGRPTSLAQFLRHLPLVAFLELAGALIVVVLAAVLVTILDNKEQWPQSVHYHMPWGEQSFKLITPAVILSLSHSAAAFLVTLALKDGITIAWWRRAYIGGTVRDLDRNYRVGSSLKDAILSFKHFNLIALATLAAAAIGFGQGPLMQDSLRVVQSHVTSKIPLQTQVGQTLPDGYTGRLLAHDLAYPDALTPAYGQVIKDYLANSIVHTDFSGCNGTCKTTVKAFGLSAECSTKTEPVKIEIKSKHGSMVPEFWRIFGSSFRYNGILGQPPLLNPITMRVSYVTTKEDGPVTDFKCSGTNTTHTCLLRPAILEYPVILQNDTSQWNSISLDTSASPYLKVSEYRKISFVDDVTSTVGGISLALDRIFGSELLVYGMPTSFTSFFPPWVNSGSLANNYYDLAAVNQTSENFMKTCEYAFKNPIDDVVRAMNEINFRTAVAVATDKDGATVMATQNRAVNRYEAVWGFMAAALAVTVAGIAMILPTFWGYWELDRKVSLNPIELAEVFNAPILQKQGNHENVEELLNSVGDREVKCKPVDVQLGEHTVHRRAIVPPGVSHVETITWH